MDTRQITRERSFSRNPLMNCGWIEWISATEELIEHVSAREDISFGERNTAESYNVAEKIALVHSELSEALEAYRKNLMDDHLPHRDGIEVELADAVIRIFGIASHLGLDLPEAILAKADYNDRRADHKPEARGGEHGKRF